LTRSDVSPPPASPAPSQAMVAADLSTAKVDLEALAAVPRALAERYRLVPLEHRGDSLLVAMVDPGDVLTIDEVARIAGVRIVPVSGNPLEIQNAISRLYTAAMQAPPDELVAAVVAATSSRRVPESVIVLGQVSPGSDAPAVMLLNQILQDAIDQRASDVHIEPHESDLFIR